LEARDVLRARPVTRLAGDAELADARVRALRARALRAVATDLDVRRGRGVVAEDAVRVPVRRVRVPVRVVGLEEHAVQVHPALLADVPEERQAPVRIAGRVAGELEVLLVAVRADAQRDLCLALAAAARRHAHEEAPVALERRCALAVELD